MTARDLLRDLRARALRLTAHGDRLDDNAPEAAMPEDILVQFRQPTPAVLALLRQAPSVTPAHTSDLPAAAAADLHARLAQAAAGGTAQLADGGILVPRQDACSCGCRVWVMQVTDRVCTACGKKDGESPGEMLGEAQP